MKTLTQHIKDLNEWAEDIFPLNEDDLNQVNIYDAESLNQWIESQVDVDYIGTNGDL